MSANVVTRMAKGIKVVDGPRGRAGLSLPERLAVRNISEAFRDLRDPIEIGRALLQVFDGRDPAKTKKANPDGLPVDDSGTIDWTHRMAAIKLFCEYAYGKPLQGVQVQALVEQHHHVHEQRPVDLRSLPPEAAAALALLARAVVGGPAGLAVAQAQVLPVPRPPEVTVDHQPADEGWEVESGGDAGEGDGEAGEGGPPALVLDVEEDALVDRREVSMRFHGEDVKPEKEGNGGRWPGAAL